MAGEPPRVLTKMEGRLGLALHYRDATMLMMAKRPTKQQSHSWAIYRVSGTPAKLLGIVHSQPDAVSAIKAAIEEFKVPPNLHNRLIAQQQRD